MSTNESAAVTPTVNIPLAVFMWLWVAIPFSYGLYQLVIKIPALFSA
ncbi:MAG: MFS transporter small subunit [Pseudonocardia sp.]